MTTEEVQTLLNKTHKILQKEGWTALLFAAKAERQAGSFCPTPQSMVYSLEANPIHQAEVSAMMKLAAKDNPLLAKFLTDSKKHNKKHKTT